MRPAKESPNTGHGHHEFGNAETYFLVGDALGKGMVKLLTPRPKDKPEPAKPTSHTTKKLEGWTVRVDDRLLKAPDAELGTKALRVIEAKLGDIKAVVPADKLKKLQTMVIVLDRRTATSGRCSTTRTPGGSRRTATRPTSPNACTFPAPRN